MLNVLQLKKWSWFWAVKTETGDHCLLFPKKILSLLTNTLIDTSDLTLSKICISGCKYL